MSIFAQDSLISSGSATINTLNGIFTLTGSRDFDSPVGLVDVERCSRELYLSHIGRSGGACQSGTTLEGVRVPPGLEPPPYELVITNLSGLGCTKDAASAFEHRKDVAVDKKANVGSHSI
ncbi:unnamed protein product [Protopolystoma xenopodis]|uniref:Uncharacterized protein n=1 Tax=Protopolystoma xenopodis TaxID=117903 RepID=A0A3S5C818_9PLAT|nr:unnamed protein product [Protopolystoma xenopodis]